MSQTGSSSACLTTDLTLPANSLDTSTANVDASCFTIHSGVEIIAENESLVGHSDGGEMIQSAKDEVNTAKDPGLCWISLLMTWLIGLLVDTVTVNTTNRPFGKSYRHYVVANVVRRNFLLGQKANGEKYKREWLLYSPSTGSVYCFICKLFAPKNVSHFVTREGISDWQNTIVIDHHEKNTTHRESILTYLTRRQSVGLRQELEKQIQDVSNNWEHVLRHVIAVFRTLAERGWAFQATEERFGSWQNGNFLGILELISQFDPFLAGHISKYRNSGK